MQRQHVLVYMNNSDITNNNNTLVVCQNTTAWLCLYAIFELGQCRGMPAAAQALHALV